MFSLVVSLFLTLPGALFAASVRQVFKEIDVNEDRAITQRELSNWFNFQDIEYLKSNAKEHFVMFDKNRDQSVSWEEYATIAFGSTHTDVCNEVYNDKTPPEFSELSKQVQDAITTAVRRWRAAGGFSMSQEEFTGFTYPELFQHMRNVVVAEAYQTYDINGDGKVSTHELLTKKFKLTGDQIEDFSKGRYDTSDSPNMLGLKDRNSNGVFDKKELGYWLMENRRLMRRLESDNVFQEMDADKNTRVSLPEFQSNSNSIKWSSIGRFIDIKEEL